MLTHSQATWARELIEAGELTVEQMHKITGASRKAIREMSKAMRDGLPHFRACAPWFCRACGGRNITTPCVRCNRGESDEDRRARLVAEGIEREARKSIPRQRPTPRHPSFTSA